MTILDGKNPRMRKLLTLWIALAALPFVVPAYADTIKSTFDFGPAYPERIALLMLTCKACHGAQTIAVNGVELTRDVTSGGAEVTEIWSAPLPEGSGVLDVTISSDHPLEDADVGMGAANAQPAPKLSIIEGAVKGSASGQRDYSMSVEGGDVVVHVARNADNYSRTVEAPSHQVAFGHLRVVSWDISAIPDFKVLGSSTVSAIAIYR
jgi:hypothetical protein